MAQKFSIVFATFTFDPEPRETFEPFKLPLPVSGLFLRVYLVLGKILNLLWLILKVYWENAHYCKWQILKNVKPFGHTATE